MTDDSDEPPTTQLGHLLQEAAAALSKARDRELSARDMTERHWLILRGLAEAGPVRLPQLMALLRHSSFMEQAPQIFDHLSEHGWMEERLEGPGGLSVFGLTPAGHSIYRETAAALQAIGERAVDGLSSTAQGTAARFLERVIAQLQAHG